MIIKTYSYRFAEEILSYPAYKKIKDELLNICQNCPIPVFPGKSKNQPEKDVIQQTMNTYFFLQFDKFGWEKEPLATPENNDDALRSDFRKTFLGEDGKKITLQIEVEFGNVASSYRNFFKFQLSYSYGMTDICVLIVPSADLANRIDSGVSNYEKVIREIPQAKLSVTVPILVIGLFDRDDNGDPIPVWDINSLGIPLKVAKRKPNVQAREEFIRKYVEEIIEDETP